MSRGAGRPTTYTEELTAEILSRLAGGESMNAICKEDDMPSRQTVFLWLRTYPDFMNMYVIAKEEAADVYAEDIVDIADNEVTQPLIDPETKMPVLDKRGHVVRVKDNVSVNHARLRIDARKWVASKLKPKKYGDRVAQEITGKDGGPIEYSSISDGELNARIEALLNACSNPDKE